jgi:DNA processing protein
MGKILNRAGRDALLALNQNSKIGAKALKKIIHLSDGEPEKIISENSTNLKKYFESGIVDAIISTRKNEFSESLLKKQNIRPVFYFDREYPELLLEIYDPPVILYCRGNIKLFKNPAIAIVGSRKHTYYSRLVLEKIIPPLVDAKISIVSGLALGVDGLAHYLTLENAGKTIGVLGSGIDKIYPTSNSKLVDRMLAENNLVISEFPPGTPPLKQNFPLRNRIISGLSLGTLVVEARYQSGSLITASLANEYGRDVYAVPGNIDSYGSEGTNELIKQGAKLVNSANDILQEIGISNSEYSDKIVEAENDIEDIILRTIENQTFSIDKIAKLTNLDIVTLNSSMSILEISGKVEKIESGFRLRGKLKQK